MAFSVSDFEDLLQLLREHPEWQAELRRVLMGDELAAINATLREMADEMRAFRAETGERLAAHDREFAALRQSLRDLSESQTRLSEAQSGLSDAQGRLVDAVSRLTDAQLKIETQVGKLNGHYLESVYRERLASYLGRKIRRARVVVPADLPRVREADAAGLLSDADWADLTGLDVLLKGVTNHPGETGERFVALEASAVIDRHDVDRANARAAILRRLGYEVIPAVAGDSVLPNAPAHAGSLGVAVLVEWWPERAA
ncbi:MAG: hypothetical protein HYX53_04875 [Chloroflexi bacterium]|nr:hypothetical protein [Chloroflexota bacterium]